jgi:hypothetical protein
MAILLKHKFQSSVPDISPNDDGLILPQAHWNDTHDLTLATGKFLGRTTASPNPGPAEEIGVSGELTLAGAELGVGSTLIAKNLSAAVLIDGYTEEVHIISGLNPTISPNNASIQTWLLDANQTPLAGPWAAGQSITLMVNDNTNPFTVNWASMPVVWVGGSAPALTPSSGYTVIQLWKVGTTIYGALVGQVA